jgi:hypothetical protein
LCTTSRNETAGPLALVCVGLSRTTTSRPMPSTTPTPTLMRYVAVQPRASSAYSIGTAATTVPSCPVTPVSWVMSGTRSGANHVITRRSTLMKTMASPAPTRSRAPSATGYSVARAKPSWPTVMLLIPARSSRRGPKRSTSSPTGTCMTTYTSSCTMVKVASAAADRSNRSMASMPATPSDDRWNTAST